MLIVHWEQVEEVEPSQVGFELNDVLHALVVITTEECFTIILVENIKFHWRLDNSGNLDKIRPVGVERIEGIKSISVIAGQRSIGMP